MPEPIKHPLGPGFWPDVPAEVYHNDPCSEPSLSSSISKVLISKTPKIAFLRHPRLNPMFKFKDDAKFDLGTAVHDDLASGGNAIKVVMGFKDWRKKDAQQERDRLRAQRFTALLEHEALLVAFAADETRAELLKRGVTLGAQEAVFIAQDRGVWLRSMMDSFDPPWINDFKTTGINLANNNTLANHIVDCGYDLQAAFYLRIAGLVFPELAGRLKFRFLFIENEEPFGLRIIEADSTLLEMGRRKMEHAIGLWQQCMASGRWSHLENLPRTVPYPNFQETRWLEKETSDGFVMGPMEALKRFDNGEKL
jgi:hypothetical protein